MGGKCEGIDGREVAFVETNLHSWQARGLQLTDSNRESDTKRKGRDGSETRIRMNGHISCTKNTGNQVS